MVSAGLLPRTRSWSREEVGSRTYRSPEDGADDDGARAVVSRGHERGAHAGEVLVRRQLRCMEGDVQHVLETPRHACVRRRNHRPGRGRRERWEGKDEMGNARANGGASEPGDNESIFVRCFNEAETHRRRHRRSSPPRRGTCRRRRQGQLRSPPPRCRPSRLRGP